MRNRYVVRSRISEARFRRFARCVAADLTAVQIAQLTGLNRNTVNRLLGCLRERMAEACELERPFRGHVEVDESYFGPRRVKGKAGRGAGKKTIVFGICKRHGKVYTEVVADCSKPTILAAIRGRVDLRSIIHSDGFKSYDGLVDMGYKKHLRVDHARDEFSSRTVRGNHINDIESFWGYAKSRLARFKGMHPSTFYLHLKECEFRFNHRRQDLYHVILRLCRDNPLS
ncbi:MAG: IS1595 family transposase [Phycisphaeraceae bacterium]|nr:IS1595 family transposase [Phycisphaeraceae bacterium]